METPFAPRTLHRTNVFFDAVMATPVTGELGTVRPFAEAYLISTPILLTALPLLWWRRHHRPLDRRPLFMRGLATVLFCAQALTRTFFAPCFVTTCLAWLTEVAMSMAVLASALQTFAVFRRAQVRTRMIKYGDDDETNDFVTAHSIKQQVSFCDSMEPKTVAL